jgi:hypothetical protein
MASHSGLNTFTYKGQLTINNRRRRRRIYQNLRNDG